jgi:hypothetical protein
MAGFWHQTARVKKKVPARSNRDTTRPLGCPPRTKWAVFMPNQMKERWLLLCEQVANEKDPTQLMALLAELNSLLESDEKRLKEARGTQPSNLKKFTLS